MPSIGRIPAKLDAVAALAASGSLLSRRAACALALAAAASALAGCVDQHPERAGGDGEPRLVATSPAVAEICDKLDMDLIGIPTTSRGIPERYEGLPEVGGAMAPDLEILKSLRPDYVISPNSLQADLQPKYAGAGLASIFVDLKSVDGLYGSATYFVMDMHASNNADMTTPASTSTTTFEAPFPTAMLMR